MRATAALARLLLAVLAASATACGPSATRDGDAGAEVDAAPPDAASTGGLGAPCTRAVPACPSDYPTCVLLSDTVNDGFCSRDCGTSPVPTDGTPPAPPASGRAICEAGYEGLASPACAVVFEPEDGVHPWACGLACGETPMGDFGTCPGNLTCVQGNPDRNGFCLPP